MRVLANFNRIAPVGLNLRVVLISLTIATGLILSVVLHELFHLGMHPDASQLVWFPSPGVIAEVEVTLPAGYDLASEEAGAYMITALVLLITAMAVTDVYDATDKRPISQILLPKHQKNRKITTVELAKIAKSL